YDRLYTDTHKFNGQPRIGNTLTLSIIETIRPIKRMKLFNDKAIGQKGLPEPSGAVLKLFFLLTLLTAGWSQSDAWAQRYPIRGEVKDEANASLADVTVQVK